MNQGTSVDKVRESKTRCIAIIRNEKWGNLNSLCSQLRQHHHHLQQQNYTILHYTMVG